MALKKMAAASSDEPCKKRGKKDNQASASSKPSPAETKAAASFKASAAETKAKNSMATWSRRKELSKETRDMLCALAMTVSSGKKQPHYPDQAVRLAHQQLADVETTLQADITKKAKASESGKAKATPIGDLRAALSASEKAVRVAQASFAERREAVKSAAKALTMAEAEVQRLNCEIGEAVMEKEQLASSSGVDNDATVSSRVTELSQVISEAAAARVVAMADVKEAQARRDETENRRRECDAAVKEAKAAQRKHVATLKAAEKAGRSNRKSVATRSQKAVKALATAELRLQELRDGPVSLLAPLVAALPNETAPSHQEAVRPRRNSWLPRHLLAVRGEEAARRRSSVGAAFAARAAAATAASDDEGPQALQQEQGQTEVDTDVESKDQADKVLLGSPQDDTSIRRLPTPGRCSMGGRVPFAN